MWYTKCGKDGDVVLSSRVRLARNIKGIPFPMRADKEQQKQVIELCKEAVLGKKIGNMKIDFIDFTVMEEYQKQAIAERHLISPQMMNNSITRGLLLSDHNKLSIMLNEEDHIRIQAMESGFDIDGCFEMANRVDDHIEETIEYDFDEKIGYLTCCPTNTGTGMRASVMVHLPALSASGTINRIIDSLAQLGLTVRGIFGEGSKATGNIYQISNQLTLGATEEDIIEKFKQIIGEVVEKERKMRQHIYDVEKFKLEDKLMRSYGVIKNAVIISSAEAMKRLSEVRFGVELGIIKDITLEQINEITYEILPANIIQKYNITDATERDLKRAEIIKERMGA